MASKQTSSVRALAYFPTSLPSSPITISTNSSPRAMDLLDDFSICGGPDSSHCLSPEQNDTSWISNDLRGFGSAFDSWVHLEEAARQPTSDASVYETPLAGSGIETGSTPGVEKRKDRDSSSAIKLSPNRGNKVAKDQSKTKTRTFACPFFKLDPTRHRACKKVKLSRVKDAKQHVHRRHMRSDPHDSCIYSDTEGVSEKQKDALSKYISRNKPIEEQWYDMWDIIFPGREHPQSVYLEDRDGFLEDTVPSLRSLWKQKRSEILSSISIETSSHIGVLDEGNLDKVVEAIFDRLGSGASAEDEDNLSANTARNPTYTETPRLIAPNTLVNQSPVDGDEVMRQDATTLLTPNSPLPIDENDLLGTGMKLSDTADIFADLLPTTFGGS
ncbi:hypothetical protein B0T17DRAFT_532759 [Bombardia bombarda]|uniref:Uncharacterized protein n=1 Tax=Bombardia bombarda TaxID=252184 RepID=A0AA40C5I2_9PEZI|nr:hypothetical protein B0T17DRAFT_532759 [Bombardia bombarda]